MMNNMMNNVMNNIEMVSRLKTAAHYQRKAVCALLPEGMESHVDVISNELKLMLKEMVETSGNEKKQGSRKIDIG
ncbi:MAG: hypothetical protein VZR64_09090 [Eubacterium sp.]|nr:hypothetical protein [Eubacterium sp.]